MHIPPESRAPLAPLSQNQVYSRVHPALTYARRSKAAHRLGNAGVAFDAAMAMPLVEGRRRRGGGGRRVRFEEGGEAGSRRKGEDGWSGTEGSAVGVEGCGMAEMHFGRRETNDHGNGMILEDGGLVGSDGDTGGMVCIETSNLGHVAEGEASAESSIVEMKPTEYVFQQRSDSLSVPMSQRLVYCAFSNKLHGTLRFENNTAAIL